MEPKGAAGNCRHTVHNTRLKKEGDRNAGQLLKLDLRNHKRTFFSGQRPAVHFGKQRRCDQDDRQMKKSDDETRVQNPQSRDRMVV